MRRKDHPMYVNWMNMIYRTRPGTRDARYYVDRGIAVCEEWQDFWKFVKDMPPKPAPKGWTLERIDNERGYEPGNVRWATQAEQMKNRRARWSDREKCPAGHRFDGSKDSRGRRTCRECRREQNRAYRRRMRRRSKVHTKEKSDG